MTDIKLLTQTTREEIEDLISSMQVQEIIRNDAVQLVGESNSLPSISYLTAKEVADIKSYIVLDLEVTHIEESKAEIVELCAIKVIDGDAVSILHTLVKPKMPIEQPIAEFICISDYDVRNAPSLSQIKDSFFNFVGDLPVCGYNLEFILKHLCKNGFADILNRKLIEVFAFIRANNPEFQRFRPLGKLYELMKIDSKNIKASRTLIDCGSNYYMFKKELLLAQQ